MAKFFDNFIADSSIIIIERIRNPFFISLISAWLFIHRLDILFLFNPNHKYSDILDLIKARFLLWDWLSFVELVLMTFLLFFTYTILSLGTYVMNTFVQKVIKPKAVKRFDPEGFISALDHRSVMDNLSEVERKMRTSDKNARQMEIERDNLREDFNSKNKELAEVILKYEGYEQDNNELKKRIKVLETKQELTNGDIGSIFPGIWRNQHTFSDGRQGQEYFRIKDGNKYYASQRKDMSDEEHVFDIVGIEHIDENQLIFTKVRPGTKQIAFNFLRKEGERYFGSEDSAEDKGTKVSYSKIK